MFSQPQNSTLEISDKCSLLQDDVIIPMTQDEQEEASLLIQDFEKYLFLAKWVGRTTVPFLFLSVLGFIISACFLPRSTSHSRPGFMAAMIISEIFSLVCAGCVCAYHCNGNRRRFMACVILSTDYDARAQEAIHLITKHQITIQQQKNPWEILSALKKIKNKLLKRDGTPSQRKFAIEKSLHLTLFGSIEQKGEGTAHHSIRNEIFAYAGLLGRPTKR